MKLKMYLLAVVICFLTTFAAWAHATTSPIISTVAGGGTGGDGGLATNAELDYPAGVAFDSAGNLYIAVAVLNRIRVVAKATGTYFGIPMTAGYIYTIAGNGTNGYSGDGGPATSAELNNPYGIATDSAGNLFIADSTNSRVRVVAKATGTYFGISMTAGYIYTVAGNGYRGSSGDGGLATGAELNYPEGVAFDSAGNLYIADSNNNRIRVVAKATGTYFGIPMTAGYIYNLAGNGYFSYSGDGGPATSAELDWPEGIAFDSAGNLYIADFFNNRIRVVAKATGTYFGKSMTAGYIYTVAGNGYGAQPGNIGTGGYSGDGGPATSAKLYWPDIVAFDSAGNLYIADYSNNRIRVVAKATGTYFDQSMTAGYIYTVAGNGTGGYSGDGGSATSAELHYPDGEAFDSAGNLYISDYSNNRIREVQILTTPTHHPFSDFDGDGKSDVLLYTKAGAVAQWLMNGAAIKGGGYVTTSLDSTWQIVGVGDFDGDGYADILLQNSSGAVVVWLMNGAAIKGGGYVTTSLDSTWKIVGVGDFDGDGKSDILLQNSSGAVVVWLMNGSSINGSGYVSTALDPSWQIKGVGDFDGDGHGDILLQNSSGAVVVWLMNGSLVTGGGYVSASSIAPWQIKGVGDFDGDGKSDLLLQNSTTGAIVVWLLNGAAIKGGGYVTASLDPGWQIKGVGDFDGDGKSDILLYNSSGAVSVWLLNGATIKSGGYVTTSLDPSWLIK